MAKGVQVPRTTFSVWFWLGTEFQSQQHTRPTHLFYGNELISIFSSLVKLCALDWNKLMLCWRSHLSWFSYLVGCPLDTCLGRCSRYVYLGRELEEDLGDYISQLALEHLGSPPEELVEVVELPDKRLKTRIWVELRHLDQLIMFNAALVSCYYDQWFMSLTLSGLSYISVPPSCICLWPPHCPVVNWLRSHSAGTSVCLLWCYVSPAMHQWSPSPWVASHLMILPSPLCVRSLEVSLSASWCVLKQWHCKPWSRESVLLHVIVRCAL